MRQTAINDRPSVGLSGGLAVIDWLAALAVPSETDNFIRATNKKTFIAPRSKTRLSCRMFFNIPNISMHISMGTKSKSESSNQEAHYESQLLVRTWLRSKAQRKKERKKEKKEKAGIDSISNDVPDYCKKPRVLQGDGVKTPRSETKEELCCS